MTRRSIAFVLVAMMLSALAAAQPYAPIVTMVVTMPDGRTQELTAAESGLATLTLKDGTEYEFRPTIQDSAPWNRIVVTVFKSATNSATLWMTISPTVQIISFMSLRRLDEDLAPQA